MINWAIDRGLMERMPFLGRSRGIRLLRENNHRYRRLQGDEEAKLLGAASRDSLMTARIIVALDTGMRRGEMLLLQNTHVLWQERLIRVVAPNAKPRKEREDPYLDAAADAGLGTAGLPRAGGTCCWQGVRRAADGFPGRLDQGPRRCWNHRQGEGNRR